MGMPFEIRTDRETFARARARKESVFPAALGAAMLKLGPGETLVVPDDPDHERNAPGVPSTKRYLRMVQQGAVSHARHHGLSIRTKRTKDPETGRLVLYIIHTPKED